MPSKLQNATKMQIMVLIFLTLNAIPLWGQKISEQELENYVQKRSMVIQQILCLVKQQPKSPVDIETQVKINKAVRMLGTLRAIETIEFLVENISMSFPLLGAGTAERGVEIQYPAVWALIQIGYPSIQMMLNKGFFKERSDLEQKLMAYVICSVLGDGYHNRWEVGRRLGRLIIQEHLRSTNPPKQVRERLIKFMEKHFPEEKLIKRR
jgi:hypothetical protein